MDCLHLNLVRLCVHCECDEKRLGLSKIWGLTFMKRWRSIYVRPECYQDIGFLGVSLASSLPQALSPHILTSFCFSTRKGCMRKLTSGFSILSLENCSKITLIPLQSTWPQVSIGRYVNTKIDSNNHWDQERGPSRICTEERELSQGACVNCVLIFFYSSTMDKPEILGITASS